MNVYRILYVEWLACLWSSSRCHSFPMHALLTTFIQLSWVANAIQINHFLKLGKVILKAQNVPTVNDVDEPFPYRAQKIHWSLDFEWLGRGFGARRHSRGSATTATGGLLGLGVQLQSVHVRVRVLALERLLVDHVDQGLERLLHVHVYFRRRLEIVVACNQRHPQLHYYAANCTYVYRILAFSIRKQGVY